MASHRPRILQVLIDAVLLGFALGASFLIRFEARIPPRYVDLLLWSVGIIVVFKLAVFYASGVYVKWGRHGTVRELLSLLRGSAVASLGAAVLVYLIFPPRLRILAAFLPSYPGSALIYPRSVLVIDALLSVMLLGGYRFIRRLLLEWPVKAVLEAGKPVLIVGAGDAGDLVVREMLKNPQQSGYTAVGYVDDDPAKKKMTMHGLKVLGTTEQLSRILEEYPVEEAIIAMPSVSRERIKEIVFKLEAEGVRCKTVPGVFQMLKGPFSMGSLRDVEVEDILGREPVRVDLGAISSYLQGRVVLVTGAGGSIGSELCRQVSASAPSKLVLLDHAESNLFAIEQELLCERDFDRIVPVLGDIKNEAKMRSLFRQLEPDVVFHAAAYKHVPLMEVNPAEAVLNNVVGTATVARVAEEFGADRFVMISTDKAVNPATVMGASKALAERIVSAMGGDGTSFIIVRFGNVLDSSGSVVPIFRSQIAKGGPVTVTHPEMTRYFMTIEEAVSLVIQAGAMGAGGEIFVLDMGEPVKIVDLAENMIRLSGLEPERDIEIAFIGIRPGEKLHEELFGASEEMLSTTHSKIRLARHAEFDGAVLSGGVDRLSQAAVSGDNEAILAALRAILPEYAPQEGTAAFPAPLSTSGG
ncbi:MAG: polysaccharide biosynthesis protein [Actinobacteria bacterium]|nr:MAG: polysaccharide biosynthesis protein [Actinomycetota bacterium]